MAGYEVSNMTKQQIGPRLRAGHWQCICACTVHMLINLTADASLVKILEILQHHPLNTSDHLPVKIEATWSSEGNNWTQESELEEHD